MPYFPPPPPTPYYGPLESDEENSLPRYTPPPPTPYYGPLESDEENSLPRYTPPPPPPPKKEISNAEIRAGLYRLLPLFLERNCQYNDGERVLVKRLMESLEPVNWEFEKYNEEHPGHGLPNQKP